MCGVQISLNKCAEEAGKGTFSIQIADLMEKMSRTPGVVYVPEHSKERLSFNATDYRSKYEFTWPETAKDVLMKASVDRTPDDIRLVRSLMRGLYSFRKYSRNLQDLICKVIRYAKYGRRRVVIRKGHPGFSFYFIFSGMAGVTLEEDEMNAFVKKEVNILKKGASFGEIALLKDSRRKATVVCLENTEFLVVDSDDFFENNLHLHIQQDFEYRMNFMSHLDLFSTWTSESIEEISDMGRMEEYCNESLIVKDARDTDWLFIVTKGRADVLKLVDLAQLYMSKQDEEEEVMQVSRKAKVLKSAFAWNDDVSSKLTKIPQHQQYQQHQQPQSDPRFPWMTGGDGHEQPQKNGKKLDVPARPKTTGQISSRTRNHIADNAHADTAHGNSRSKSATVRLKVPSDKLDGSGDEGTNEHQSNGVYRSNQSRASSANHRRRTFSEPTEEMPTLPNHIKLGLETIKAPGVEAGVYIQVDALRSGDFFGIQGIKGEMPHLSLVSHGCEVIRISMSKFREFADDETLAKVNKLLPTYASGLELWRSFQKQNKWRNFKNGVITDVMRHAHQSDQAAIVERAGPRSRRSVTSDWVTNTWSRRSSMGGESSEVRNTPLPKIMTSAVERGSGPRSPRPRRRGKSAGVSNASTSRPGSRALTASRPPSTRVSDSRPPTRHSMSNHDLRILENRRSSVPASRFVSASQSLNNQQMARTLSAVGGAMSSGGEKRYNSQQSMPHLNIPDLANFTKPTFTRSRSWRELKS
ncbi:uncharacterized protein LOC100888893 [Strongylocentrotus purpuratus]|uniref:Cyclic nucleotide-binding domain-containing protein 2 n=1 Tax=Strongylocentrotus purpuratus TaxID=7668 RepID=A0A7M7MY63_STRPU|nr:uncharacterized protein LOC100888893 [Strongylocentrotus purpuratus]